MRGRGGGTGNLLFPYTEKKVQLIKFVLIWVYGLRPSPVNLHRWDFVEDARCHLCDKPGTMQHALSSCQTALAQGRYRWRHDIVLRELTDILERERRKKTNTKKKAINFVKESQRGKKTKAPTTSVLDESKFWEIKVDLGEELLFFPNIIHTAQRPDTVIWSPNDRKLVIVERRSPVRQDVRKPMNGRWQSTLNYENSAGGVVGVPGCFPWR